MGSINCNLSERALEARVLTCEYPSPEPIQECGSDRRPSDGEALGKAADRSGAAGLFTRREGRWRGASQR